MTSSIPRLDRDRYMALGHVPTARRSRLAALWGVDAALGAAVAHTRDPAMSQIKLVWWRDSLEALDRVPAPAASELQEAAAELLPAGIRGADLAQLVEGWTQLLSPQPLVGLDLDIYAVERGGRLFLYAARLLGGAEISAIAAAGEAWALIDLARRSTDPGEVEAAVQAARQRFMLPRWPPSLRPIGMLAVLARRDAEAGRKRWEKQGSLRRIFRMARHNITGT